MRPAAWRYLMPLLVLPTVLLMAALWITAAQGRAEGLVVQAEASLNGSR